MVRPQNARNRRRLRWASAVVVMFLLGAARECEMEGTVYGLIDESALALPQLPCIPPDCPPPAGDLGGTFRLVEMPRAPQASTRVFRVEDVFWLARNITGYDLRITGSGTYSLEEEPAQTQRLVLDLHVAGILGEGLHHYDSGTVPIPPDGAHFPAIDVAVHRENGDTIYVRGVPFPREGETACGPGLLCDTQTEICVEEADELFTFRCEAFPAGCEDDRSCGCAADALCEDSSATDCFEGAENTIVCCPRCV